MANHGLHYSSVSRYMSGRTSGYRRTGGSVRNRYAPASSTYRSYLQEAMKAKEQLEESGSSEETSDKSNDTRSSALSKYTKTRTKAATYNLTGSKFNNGVKALEESADDITELLAKDDPDMGKIYSAAQDFSEGYNKMYSSVKGSANSSVSAKAKSISDVTDILSRTLEKVGIAADKDGNLSIDKEKFMSSDKKDLQNVFGAKASYASMVRERAKSLTALSGALSSMSGDTYSLNRSDAYTSALSGSLLNKFF